LSACQPKSTSLIIVWAVTGRWALFPHFFWGARLRIIDLEYLRVSRWLGQRCLRNRLPGAINDVLSGRGGLTHPARRTPAQLRSVNLAGMAFGGVQVGIRARPAWKSAARSTVNKGEAASPGGRSTPPGQHPIWSLDSPVDYGPVNSRMNSAMSFKSTCPSPSRSMHSQSGSIP
jgi:hypothetical protein